MNTYDLLYFGKVTSSLINYVVNEKDKYLPIECDLDRVHVSTDSIISLDDNGEIDLAINSEFWKDDGIENSSQLSDG